MKRERILNIVLGTLLLVLVAALAFDDERRTGMMTARHQPAEGLVVKLHTDTVWIHDTIRTAGPVVVREEVREVPAAVDTAAILSAYYTARTLSDTFHLRDVATVRITDTLLQNDIVGRHVDYDLAQVVPTAVTIYPSETPTDRIASRIGTPVRLALSLGAQLGSEQAAVMGGVRFKRVELVGAYDLRLRAPSITLKFDVRQWQ